ncbi:peroxidasin-like protein, partial [Dinothrombium tinctorium]
YNDWRAYFNLSVSQTFDDLRAKIKSRKLRDKLRKLYGHPDNIDLFVGGVAEDPLPNAKVGSTFLCLLVDQFRRTRDGDRFWYENNVFTDEQLAEIKKITLAKVICDSGDDTDMITKDVFVIPSKQGWSKCTELTKQTLRFQVLYAFQFNCSILYEKINFR